MGNAWIAYLIGIAAIPFLWLAHLLGHSYPAEHEGCRWCKPGTGAHP